MKILELRFKNLNSLYGEWQIDFTNPDYSAGGIFAMIGPTGAGKSTILDAVCLALYGATPRLGRITKSGNGIMSRQTGECYAEVLFESQSGRFRCHWEQRRARKNAEGKLQDQEHQIIDANSGKPLETKKSLVAAVIEEKTGMDFERFTRSILLAQGRFDSFLRADIEQKSKILEQITGTEIYTDISRRIHERHRESSLKLDHIKAETAGIVLLETAVEREFEQNISWRTALKKRIEENTCQISQALDWLVKITSLQEGINRLDDDDHKLKKRLQDFAPQREKLARALSAAALEGDYATLLALRKQQRDDSLSLDLAENQLPELKQAVLELNEQVREAEKQLSQKQQEQKDAAPLFELVRDLDLGITQQLETIKVADGNLKVEQAHVLSLQSQQRQLQESLLKLEDLSRRAQAYLDEHAVDQGLALDISGIEDLITRFQQKLIETEVNKEKADKAQAGLSQTQQQIDICVQTLKQKQRELEAQQKKIEQSDKLLIDLLADRLLREYRQEKDFLQEKMIYLARISELESHRIKLKDEEPCPLCGALEHPFALGNVPQADETEQRIQALSHLISKAEEIESEIEGYKQQRMHLEQSLRDSETSHKESETSGLLAERSLQQAMAEQQNSEQELGELEQQLHLRLNPYVIDVGGSKRWNDVLPKLRKRLNDWTLTIEKKEEYLSRTVSAKHEIEKLHAVLEMRKEACAQQQASLGQLQHQHGKLSEQRMQQFGDRDVATESKKMQQAIEQTARVERQALANVAELDKKLSAVQSAVRSARERIETRKTELDKAQGAFLGAAQKAGFVDEDQFLAACLSSADQGQLQEQVIQLDEAQTVLNTRRRDREKELCSERERQLTDQSSDILEHQLVQLKEDLDNNSENIRDLEYRLRENSSAKALVRDKQLALEKQMIEHRRWSRLHELIGSADGKKYRNFAQGLTFEMMVAHANRQLVKMNDRYLLLRDSVQPLELSVVDNYQAGEVRSTKNLSGGESFIVSLALALGLSRMASRKVRVDSLFLDEGFGTLDEDTLETALEALALLQRDDKLIGVISHVPALRERISAQIKVIPVSGGRSILSGPGCHRLA